MKMCKIMLVIVNYNEPENTIKLINTIAGFKCAHYIERILILNNGAKNVDLDGLRANRLKIESKLIDNNGFGAALNIGIRRAIELDFDFIWSLNVDVEISENTLEELLKVIREDRIVGSVIHDRSESGYIYQYGTNGLNTWRGYQHVKPSIKNEIIVDAVAGTSMVIGRKVFSNTIFDEQYFMYVEENDYCYFAKKNGYRSYVCTKSVVVHQSGGSFNNKSIRWYYKVRNLLRFKEKFENKSNKILIVYLLLITIRNFGFDISYLMKYFEAVRDYNNNKYGKHVEV